jgi:non-specific serine/threonine protein kinase
MRHDFDEAQQFHDWQRAARIEEDINCVAQQLASAIGLGGRDRKSLTDSERARTAVTKRIRAAIKKIRDSMPSLGRHLAVHVKTGYFCSYNPPTDGLISWRF